MFTLMDLPFKPESLEPYISARTLEFHYGKHHRTYVDNLNNLVKDNDFAATTLEKIIELTAGQPDEAALFNNAAQVYNHNFYWQSLKPGSGEAPADIQKILADSFGSYEKFQEQFKAAAVGQFGSGWAWLIFAEGKVKLLKTGNADNPIAQGKMPLLVIDVWEHAYYLDYQNRRADYAEAIIKNLLNWDFFRKNLAAA